MKLIAQIKLLCSEGQKQSLQDTLRLMNSTCDEISKAAWSARKFGRSSLQKLCYLDAKSNGLTAQMAIHATRKVADAYKKDKKTLRQFRPTGAITFDDRVLSWKPEQQNVSIWTVAGRQTIAYACGERQSALSIGVGTFCIYYVTNHDPEYPAGWDLLERYILSTERA